MQLYKHNKTRRDFNGQIFSSGMEVEIIPVFYNGENNKSLFKI